jgi:hypothetical protein
LEAGVEHRDVVDHFQLVGVTAEQYSCFHRSSEKIGSAA